MQLCKCNYFQFQTHKKSVQQRLRKIEQLNKRAAAKTKKSADLEQQLPEMQVTVSELRHICEAAGNENSHFSSN